MILILFFLFGVEEDRNIPIILPDYTDSLPVLMPSNSTKNAFNLAYGYPNLFFSSFKNKYVNIGIGKQQDIDKYLKWWGETTLNTHYFNLFFSLPYIGKNGVFTVKPLLNLGMNWKSVNADVHLFPMIFSKIPLDYSRDSTELQTMGRISLGYLRNGVLIKFFREYIYGEKNGLIIQYTIRDRGVRIRMSNRYTGEFGYFSPLFYIKIGRDNRINIDSISPIPFVYPDIESVKQDYAEMGFLYSKIRLSKFYSRWFFDYDTEKNVFTTKFSNGPMWAVSFSLNNERNGINLFLGVTDKIEMEGIEFNTTKTFNIFKYRVKGYGGYFKDYGYYGTGGIAIKLKKKISPLIEINNINYGNILGYNFLSTRIYVGLEYESIQ